MKPKFPMKQQAPGKGAKTPKPMMPKAPGAKKAPMMPGAPKMPMMKRGGKVKC